MSEPEPEAEDQDTTETERAVSPTDNVGDISVEVNVEDLIAELEAESKGDAAAAAGKPARRRIEDILEEKRLSRDIMDLEDFDVEE